MNLGYMKYGLKINALGLLYRGLACVPLFPFEFLVNLLCSLYITLHP